MRVVSVLEVADAATWAELEARAPLADHVAEHLSPTRRVVKASFERLLPTLQEQGAAILVRYARREAKEMQAARDDLAKRIEALPIATRAVLHHAQRHALDDVVLGRQAWDPEHDGAHVRALCGAGLMMAVDTEAAPYSGSYRVSPDLPPAPIPDYDFSEALMPETDDLEEATPGPFVLLHDLAALAAALLRVVPRRTHAGAITKADARKLGRRLGDATLATDGNLAAHPRWQRALRALQALGAVSTDPLSRELFLDLGLEQTLAGEATEAVDRFVHRMLERDLHVLLPAVRSALHQAGDGAVDELVFHDLLRSQDREVLFPKWRRHGLDVYPALPGEDLRPWDHDGWDRTEARMVSVALSKIARMGLIRQAPGVFAGTADGRAWAAPAGTVPPTMWVSSDMECIVPPAAVTPWERFQLERFGRCLGRDVVDRYRLERDGLAHWLVHHELPEALALLRRRSPAVPVSVVETLEDWARSFQRVVLIRGVLIE